MLKLVLIVGIIAAAFIAEASCQRPHIIYPTYRPPPQRPIIIRTVRQVDRGEPLWLYKDDNIDRAPTAGEHPRLPPYIDPIRLDPLIRTARSFDSRSSRHSGGSHATSSGSRDTGATHPGYNRRNA